MELAKRIKMDSSHTEYIGGKLQRKIMDSGFGIGGLEKSEAQNKTIMEFDEKYQRFMYKSSFLMFYFFLRSSAGP